MKKINRISRLWEGEKRREQGERERVKAKNLRCPVFQSKVTEWIDTSLLWYTY